MNDSDLTATYKLKRILACIDNTNIQYDNELINLNYDESTNDIRGEQDQLNTIFSKLNVTQSNEMQLNLFHLHKVSNAPLILFDRITNWL